MLYTRNPEYISSFELLLLFNNYLKKEYIVTYTLTRKYKRAKKKKKTRTNVNKMCHSD